MFLEDFYFVMLGSSMAPISTIVVDEVRNSASFELIERVYFFIKEESTYFRCPGF